MPRKRSEPDSEAAELYRQLWEADLDEVHELVARHGPSILQRGKPYLLTAARRLAVSRWRKDQRRSQLEQIAATDPAIRPQFEDDPAALVEKLGDVEALKVALAELPNPQLLVLWRRAEGYGYSDIAREWFELGFGELPSAEYLRQQYHRTIEQVKARLNARSNPS